MRELLYLPLLSDNPAVSVEQRHGWLVPPAWEFISEVWEYERKAVSEVSMTMLAVGSHRCIAFGTRVGVAFGFVRFMRIPFYATLLNVVSSVCRLKLKF